MTNCSVPCLCCSLYILPPPRCTPIKLYCILHERLPPGSPTCRCGIFAVHFTTTPAALQWARKCACTQKELESFLGHLSHAAIVIPKGHVFLHQMFPLLSRSRAPHHYVHFNLGTWADLLWWRAFLQGWSGNHSIQSRQPRVRSFQMQLVHSAVGLSLVATVGSTSHGQTTGSQSTSQQRSTFQQLSLQQAEAPSGATNGSVQVR